MKPIAIDLFCGAGGMSEGLSMAGFDIRLAIDSDPYAYMIYTANQRQTLTLWQDTAKLKRLESPLRAAGLRKAQVALVAGGPPCQGFSRANRRTNHAGNVHNTMVDHFLRLVKEVMPPAVLMENVDGLKSFDEGSVHDRVVRRLEQFGYEVESQILNAADFGAPQFRRRVLIVASDTGGFTWPKETHGTDGPNPWVTVAEAIVGDLPPLNGSRGTPKARYRGAPRTKYQRAMRRSCSVLYDHITTMSEDRVKRRFALIPPGSGLFYLKREGKVPRDLRIAIGHHGVYRRLDPSRPSLTIANVGRNLTIHPHEDRILSLREAARLQSFRDGYRFPGSLGKMQQAVGNAVPPLLARPMAKQIYRIVGKGS